MLSPARQRTDYEICRTCDEQNVPSHYRHSHSWLWSTAWAKVQSRSTWRKHILSRRTSNVARTSGRHQVMALLEACSGDVFRTSPPGGDVQRTSMWHRWDIITWWWRPGGILQASLPDDLHPKDVLDMLEDMDTKVTPWNFNVTLHFNLHTEYQIIFL